MPVELRKRETIEVKSNLILTLRERGKLVQEVRGHNIWLDIGRTWLAQLIAYSSFSPLTPYTDFRIRYMGLGIGGTRQIAPAVANNPPLGGVGGAYAGTNVYTDTDPGVTHLERPVRISGGTGAYPGAGSDVWLGQIASPPTFPTATSVNFQRLFTEPEVSYSSFLTVPLSEVALFHAGASETTYNNAPVAYDTFDTLSKTGAFALEVNWTVRF